MSNMGREEVLTRYRNLRAISKSHHHAAMKFLSRATILENARQLGMLVDQTVVADSDEEFTLIYDLAIYTAREGRSRAIDRYARAAQLSPDSDEAALLAAMCRARFSIWHIADRHDTCGLVINDLLRNTETWLVDEGLEKCAKTGMCLAGRLFDADQFSMTSGAMVPTDWSLLKDVLTDGRACRYNDLQRIADDPRFATAIYRAALDYGAMENVEYA
jgi:hypothetical protein